MGYICSNLKNIPNVTSLNLRENSFTSKGMEELSKGLKHLKNLTELFLNRIIY